MPAQSFLGLMALLLLLPWYALADVLAGRVVDENGAPVPGARIVLDRHGRVWRAESGEAGQFELPDVGREIYALRDPK